uniref:receptor-like protein EIX2 n=1 Tax=Erigeron canadensis TaxID=72917 RepID=UPI001CB95E99|nr:receptor-like protein EIX2 [Erigeron canadensis]
MVKRRLMKRPRFTNDAALCKDVERRALFEFKHGLIDRADQLASWSSRERDCCKWTGIVCDNITGHVHRIHLRGAGGNCRVEDYSTTKEYDEISKYSLGGDISSSLMKLKMLKYLDLSCNNFSEINVPSFLGSLQNLRYLNISSSRFGGIIPPQIGNLSRLEVLSLGSFYDDSYGSELTSMVNVKWLSNLRLLRHLDMSGVDLSKAVNWLQVINTLPFLVELHMSNCQLTNVYPHVSSLNVTSLSLLDISDNYFDNSSVPMWIFSISSLVSLELSRCNFHGHIGSSMHSFHNLTSLQVLHVSGNDFINSSLVLKELSSIGSNLISLEIQFCGLTSPVLASLQNLTSLQSLDMSQNLLTKEIPRSFGYLCNLRRLDLSGNNFQNVSFTSLLESILECKSPRLESLSLVFSGLSGHLPDSIGRLSFLRSLLIKENLISGSIPNSVGQLLSLETLDLRNNQLNGSLPVSLGVLSNLTFLGLSYNLLTGVVTEAHFEKLDKLRVFWAARNKLSLKPHNATWVPSFQLQILGISYWDLGSQFPMWLKFQRNLETLDISNTNISSTIPDEFWTSVSNLQELNVSQNNIQGRLSSIPAKLSVIDLSSNNFSGSLPKLSKNSLAHKLDLSNNLFTGSMHHFLCLNSGESLELLNFANNQLSGVIPDCWLNWPTLSFVSLENNNLSGVIPATLGSLFSLGTLNLCNNKLSGSLPGSLRSLASLEILQLARNELFGRIPSWVGKELLSLRILNLRFNKFDRDIPHELCGLTAIQILVLSHNNLTGNIPKCFDKFSVLSGNETTLSGRIFTLSILGTDLLGSASLVTKGREEEYSTILRLVMILDLSSNKLSGHIPGELMSLHALQSLNLSRNQLTGEIPNKIGDMKSLESFDISLNQLSGKLPMSLSRLNFLSSFNVSYNNLTGRVPSSTQLQGFDESSFNGNNLCGDPVTKRCIIDVPDARDQEEGDDGSRGRNWGLLISILCGFGAGFWLVLAPLLVSPSWRIKYFSFLNGMWYMFCGIIQKCG